MLFLSLEDGDSDVTEIVLVFEQLLYDLYEVFGWFVWGKLERFLRLKDLDFKAQKMEVLWIILVFESKWILSACFSFFFLASFP